MDWPLYKVVFGIRHRRTFAFSATSGRIIDALASRTPPKSADPFSLVQLSWAPDRMAFRMSNKEGNYYLDCNIDGFVLTYHFMENDVSSEQIIRTQFISILNSSLHITEAKDYVNRIGVMNYYSIDAKDNSAKVLFQNLLKLDIRGMPDTFLLRFGLKDVTAEGLVDSTRGDYSNVIFSISSDKIERESLTPPNLIDFQVDYQIYFEPERKYASQNIDLHFTNFLAFIRDLQNNKTLRLDRSIQ